MAEMETVSCVKNEVFVYKIPARPSNRGYRAADWKLDNPDWTGRMKIVAKGKECAIKLEDKNTGELFASCPVESYPSIAVEQVLDSSRYFVVRIQDVSGRNAFIGIGFADRGDSFDLLVALQDHFKWVKREETEAKDSEKHKFEPGPKLDLGFKEGQTIKININTKKNQDGEGGVSRPRQRGAGSGLGILPPPPGGMKIPAPPPGGTRVPMGIVQPQPQQPQPASQTPAKFPDFQSQPQPVSFSHAANLTPTHKPSQQQSNVDLLLDLGAPAPPTQAVAPMQQSTAASLDPFGAQNFGNATDPWGDFASANAGTTKPASNTGNADSWVNFE